MDTLSIEEQRRIKISAGLKRAYASGLRKPIVLSGDKEIERRVKIGYGLKRAYAEHRRVDLTPSMRLVIRKVSGEKHYLWGGENVGYRTIHAWVQRHLGKASYCSNNINHKSNVYHWANISGEYKRDLSDWKSLCPTCNKRSGVKIHKRFKKTN